MSFSTLVMQDEPTLVGNDFCSPSLPGLPYDVAKYCLALVPRSYFPAMGAVCKIWRSFIKSKEFITVRKLGGLLEEWLYVLIIGSEANESHWEALDHMGHKCQLLPPMPGPVKAGFEVVVVNGKILLMASYSLIDATGSASADVYEYNSCLNGWRKLSNMNVARYDLACTEVNDKVYAVGGHGMDGDSLSSVEMYDPDTNRWTLIESLPKVEMLCMWR